MLLKHKMIVTAETFLKLSFALHLINAYSTFIVLKTYPWWPRDVYSAQGVLFIFTMFRGKAVRRTISSLEVFVSSHRLAA